MDNDLDDFVAELEKIEATEATMVDKSAALKVGALYVCCRWRNYLNGMAILIGRNVNGRCNLIRKFKYRLLRHSDWTEYFFLCKAILLGQESPEVHSLNIMVKMVELF